MLGIAVEANDVLLWTTTQGHTSVRPSERTYIHHFSADAERRLEDRAMVDRDG